MLIVLAAACLLPREGIQSEDLTSPMALHGGGPTLKSNGSCCGNVVIAEGRLPVLFAFALDLHPCCVQIAEPPGNSNGLAATSAAVED